MRSFLVYGAFLLLAGVGVVTGAGASPGYIPPKPTVNVHLHNYTLRNYPMSRARFTCNFTESSAESLYYRVSWWREGVVWYNTSYAQHSNNDSLFLTEELFVQQKFKMGDHIACSVRANNAVGSASGNSSEMSATFFVGIKILTPSLSFDIGERNISKRTIRLQPTVPVGCFAESRCTLWLTTNTNYSGEFSHCTGDVIQKSMCGVLIQSETYSSELHIPVTTTDSGQYQSNPGSYEIFLKTDYIRQNLIWSNYCLPPIKVHVAIPKKVYTDRTCFAHHGAQMRTFYGRLYYIQEDGVFTLYRHAGFDTEIQIQHATCDTTTKSKCVCGVAARAGQDRYVIDVCDGKLQIGYMDCGDNVMEAKRTSAPRYKIVLPQGTYADIIIEQAPTGVRYLSVDVTPSIHDDGGAYLGLCGLIDEPGATLIDDPWGPGRPLTVGKWKVISASQNLFHADFNIAQENPWLYEVCGCETNIGSAGKLALVNEIPCRKNTVASCTRGQTVHVHSCSQPFG